MDRLLEEVMENCCSECSARRDWVPLGAPRLRKTARIYRVRSGAFASDVAVKIFLGKESARQHACGLHSALERYRPAGTDSLFAAVPLALVERRNAVIMRWVDAPDLQRAIYAVPGQRLERHEAIRRSGEWLRWFHRSGGLQELPFEVDAVLRAIRAMAATLPNAGGSAELAACLELLGRRADIVRGRLVAHGSVHGDFTPYNLLLSRDQAVGIDFLASRGRATVMDANRMLMYLFAHRYGPVSAGMLGPLGCARRDWRAFARGYGPGLLSAGPQAFLYFQFLETMRRWICLLAESEPPSVLFRSIEKARIRMMALHIAELLR